MKQTVQNMTFGLGLLIIAFLNCGFTWGFGTKDQCGEARKIAEALSLETSGAERAQAGESVLNQEPQFIIRELLNVRPRQE